MYPVDDNFAQSTKMICASRVKCAQMRTTSTSAGIRLEDIAARTGVSISTVSSVLAGNHKKRRISDLTAQKVLAAADRFHYEPRRVSHGAILESSSFVSFYNTFREVGQSDKYMEKLLLALHLEGGKQGFATLFHSIYKNPPTDVYELISKRILSGLVLFAAAPDDPVISVARESDLPSVILFGVDPLGVLHSVREDVHGAMQLISRKLITQGHRKIVAIQEDGRLVRDSEIRCLLLNRYFTMLGGEVIIKTISSRDELPNLIKSSMKSALKPTAVFAWHDYLGYDVLKVSESLGFVIPKDFSVIGYDGVYWPDRSNHRLCTIDVGIDRTCEAVYQTLRRLISHQPVDLDQTLEVTFDEGTTFANIA
jgi:LacI family transcriptional regulator